MSNPGEIDLAPIHAAVEARVREGASWRSIALRAGWKSGGLGDSTNLKRRLGLKPVGGVTSRKMRYETALRIVEAINGDPVDFGL